MIEEYKILGLNELWYAPSGELCELILTGHAPGCTTPNPDLYQMIDFYTHKVIDTRAFKLAITHDELEKEGYTLFKEAGHYYIKFQVLVDIQNNSCGNPSLHNGDLLFVPHTIIDDNVYCNGLCVYTELLSDKNILIPALLFYETKKYTYIETSNDPRTQSIYYTNYGTEFIAHKEGYKKVLDLDSPITHRTTFVIGCTMHDMPIYSIECGTLTTWKDDNDKELFIGDTVEITRIEDNKVWNLFVSNRISTPIYEEYRNKFRIRKIKNWNDLKEFDKICDNIVRQFIVHEDPQGIVDSKWSYFDTSFVDSVGKYSPTTQHIFKGISNQPKY